MQLEQVILVNEADEAIGTMEKLEAHRKGLLHRAISVFLFDSRGRLLLQQRATHKYHSGGLWTNTCCSHPAPGETAHSAAIRRLGEEMGLQAPLTFAFTLLYRAAFDNGLVDPELDHALIGSTEPSPAPDPAEVATYRWADRETIDRETATNPKDYTAWFKLIYRKVFDQAVNAAS